MELVLCTGRTAQTNASRVLHGPNSLRYAARAGTSSSQLCMAWAMGRSARGGKEKSEGEVYT